MAAPRAARPPLDGSSDPETWLWTIPAKGAPAELLDRLGRAIEFDPDARIAARLLATGRATPSVLAALVDSEEGERLLPAAGPHIVPLMIVLLLDQRQHTAAETLRQLGPAARRALPALALARQRAIAEQNEELAASIRAAEAEIRGR